MTTVYDYIPYVMNAIELISQGETETAACDKVGIRIGVFKSYVNSNAQLQELYVEAMQRGHDAMADALISIDNHRIHGRSDPKMAKVISDNIKWLLERRAAKKYGAKLEVQHNLTLDRAIVDALTAAKNRVSIAHDRVQPVIIDVEPELSEEEAHALVFAGT